MSLISTIRSAVINNSVVQNLISDRFYEGQIATVLKDDKVRVEFPCATFLQYAGNVDPDISKVQIAYINIWVWSENSYDEAEKIYDAIFNVLHNMLLTDSEVKFVTKETGRPTKNYDSIEKTYVLFSSWRAMQILI